MMRKGMFRRLFFTSKPVQTCSSAYKPVQTCSSAYKRIYMTKQASDVCFYERYWSFI